MIIKKYPKKLSALVVATAILMLNFWAWSLISPLATKYKSMFELSPLAVSMLVAAPVLVGSLGRIPIGLLADRYGGRRIFAVVCLLASVAVGSLMFVNSYDTLLVAAIGLGVAGASFAAGIPFINAWFPKQQRGFALGVYALGNAGTAVSGLMTPWLSEVFGRQNMFLAVAAMLFVSGLAMWLFGRESPSWRQAKEGNMKRLLMAIKWELTWKLSLLYGLTFGAFVALGLYLPVLLNQSYGLTPTDASARAAGFVLLATLMRPVGGWLSDCFSGLVVIRAACFMLFVLAAFAAMQLELVPFGTVAYLGLAIMLGIGNGAVFAVIGHRCPPTIIGAVTGVVGAAGGLGGYFPPLVMGISFQLFGSYTVALGLLAFVSIGLFFSLRRLFGFHTTY